MFKSVLLLSTSLLACPLMAQAQDTDPKTTDVVVTITRQSLPVAKVGQPVDVITAADIKSYQSLFVGDLLAHTTDLNVARNGGPGEAAAASIRGAGADHTLYLLDGVRLNDPSQVGGGTNLGLLTVGDADRLEILRGPLSTLWGAGALGGVVSITSHVPTQPLEGTIALEGLDHYGSARASLGGKTGNVTWGLAASTYNDQGVSAFAGGSEKDGFTQTGLSGRLAYDVSATTSLHAYAGKTHSRNAYDGYAPPTYAFGDTGDFGKTETTIGAVGLTNRYDAGEQTLSLSATDSDRHDYYDGGFPLFTGRGHVQAADYHASYRLGATRLLGGVSYERDSVSGDSHAVATLASVYGQVAHDFGVVDTTLSARHDDASSFGGLDTVQASLSAPAGDHLRFHASAGTGVKAPSLYQLYSFYGTDSLKVEREVSLDAGVDVSYAGGTVSATAFSRRVRDQIDFVNPDADHCTSAQIYGCYANIDRTRASGLELAIRQDLTASLHLTANYSFLTTRNLSAGVSGNRLARTPDQLGSADLTWQATGSLAFGFGVRHVGRAFDDTYNSRRLKAYTLADIRADYRINDRLSLYGRLENAGDTRYETAADYGQPGRRLWLGVRARVF